MRRLTSGLAIVLAFSAWGCAEEAPPAPPGGGGSGSGGIIMPPPTGGSGGSGGAGGAGGIGGMAGAGGGAGAGGVGGGVLPGACDNMNDVDALAALQPDNGRRISAVGGSAQCSDLLFDRARFTTCVTQWVGRNVPNLSLGCAACYGELAWCAGLLCNTSCAQNSCETGCLTCNTSGNYVQCVADLNECAGRTSVDCPGDT